MGNVYGRLGALRPSNTSEAELYSPGSTAEAVATVIVCNQDTSERTYRLALTNASGSADGEDWLAYDKTIDANETHEYSGICVDYPETIRVKASVADKISFVAFGLEITP